MAYALHRATLALHGPFGTPLAGDTLFGHLCWALREAAGEAELTRRLAGYRHGQPWLVVSDGFPAGHLPKPTLPQHYLPAPDDDRQARKEIKAQRWVPVGQAAAPLRALLAAAVDDQAAFAGHPPQHAPRTRNTLDRLSGTTGTGDFAPYTLPQTWYCGNQSIDLYLVLDDERLSADEATRLLQAVGSSGYGRDAGVGLGKFTLARLQPSGFPSPAGANACWTLAPCAPQGQHFDGERSYWRVLTRFGRHGNILALAGRPFKTPLLLAAAGAVFSPSGRLPAAPFVGQGIGGDRGLSNADVATVHQGYAPFVPLALENPS